MLGFLGSGITSFGCGKGIGCNGGGLTCWAEAGLVSFLELFHHFIPSFRHFRIMCDVFNLFINPLW